MSSSKVITSKFDFFKADTIESALDYLLKDNIKILAGGTDLINLIKADRITPDGVLFIGNIPGLKILSTQNGLTIGAATVMEEVEKNSVVSKKYPGLAEAINSVGGWQIRNSATVIGNICNASPGADTVPVLVVHGAKVVIARKENDITSERTVLLEDFLTGPGQIALEKGELVTAVKLPEVPDNSSSAFMRIARVTLDIAKVNCAAWILMENNICTDVKIAVGSVASTVVRSFSVENALRGQKLTLETICNAAAEVVKDISPITDIRSTGKYRKKVAPVLVRDVLIKAVERAGGDK